MYFTYSSHVFSHLVLISKAVLLAMGHCWVLGISPDPAQAVQCNPVDLGLAIDMGK